MAVGFQSWRPVVATKLSQPPQNSVLRTVVALDVLTWPAKRVLLFDLHSLKLQAPFQRFAGCIADPVLQVHKSPVSCRSASKFIRKCLADFKKYRKYWIAFFKKSEAH